jgi:peptide chain release factor 2
MNDDLAKRLAEIKKRIDLDKLRREIGSIEALSAQSEFWQDQQSAGWQMKKLAALQKELAEIEELDRLLKEGKIKELTQKIAPVELKTFFAGQYDSLPVIFSVHAGQGGVEAMDWAAMLKRMYLRFFEKRGWEVEMLEETPGEEAGVKSTTFKVNSPFAYGYLKHEAGTHRLVRQSPFNADRLRQTSFALVEVLPQIQEMAGAEIEEKDLDWEFYRSSSQGGQNVQKVSTAVRLHHQPSGIIVTCQSQRYQEQNRKLALEILRAKLWGLKQVQAKKEEHKLKGGRTKASWGTQIRSYVLHPYKMVKDLRTSHESSNPQAVLDGELEEFIEAEVRQLS